MKFSRSDFEMQRFESRPPLQRIRNWVALEMPLKPRPDQGEAMMSLPIRDGCPVMGWSGRAPAPPPGLSEPGHPHVRAG